MVGGAADGRAAISRHRHTAQSRLPFAHDAAVCELPGSNRYRRFSATAPRRRLALPGLKGPAGGGRPEQLWAADGVLDRRHGGLAVL